MLESKCLFINGVKFDYLEVYIVLEATLPSLRHVNQYVLLLLATGVTSLH